MRGLLRLVVRRLSRSAPASVFAVLASPRGMAVEVASNGHSLPSSSVSATPTPRSAPLTTGAGYPQKFPAEAVSTNYPSGVTSDQGTPLSTSSRCSVPSAGQPDFEGGRWP